MSERERLVEMLIKIPKCFLSSTDCTGCEYRESEHCWEDRTADAILENGAIVPPCKMDDKLYTVIYDDVPKEWYISEDIIGEVGKTGLFVSLGAGLFEYIAYAQIGKDYFLNREDAEKALEVQNEKQ